MAIKIFQRRPLREYMLLSEAWILISLSRCLIFLIPFRKLLPIIGHPVSQEEAEKFCINSVASIALLDDVKISILRASHLCPWRTKCFEQALAARMMLKNRGIKSIIYFGIRKYPSDQYEKLLAHAWLKCSGIVVTGGKNNEMFTVVGCFKL